MKNRGIALAIIICSSLIIIGGSLTAIIYLLHADTPGKIAAANSSQDIKPAADYEVKLTGGALHDDNLWDFYYGKSIDEVKAVAPLFIETTEDGYRLDSGFMDEDTKAIVIDLYGFFEDGYLTALGIKGDIGVSVCGYSGGNLNEDDLEVVAVGALAFIKTMGLEATDEGSAHSDDYSMIYLYTTTGEKCGFPVCPGSDISVVCMK